VTAHAACVLWGGPLLAGTGNFAATAEAVCQGNSHGNFLMQAVHTELAAGGLVCTVCTSWC
jgi:hypothetical protein